MEKDKGIDIPLSDGVDPLLIISSLVQSSVMIPDESLFSFIRFMRTRAPLGVLRHNPNSIKIIYHSRWTSKGSLLTSIDFEKEGKNNLMRIAFQPNPLTRWGWLLIFSVISTSSAYQLFSNGIVTPLRALIFLVVAVIIGFIFALPILLISLHARKETRYFLQEVVRQAEQSISGSNP